MKPHATDSEFKCVEGCTKCCTDKGRIVELTLPDIIRLNKRLNILPEKILEEHGEISWSLIPYTHTLVPSLTLKMPCKFLKDGKCSIYSIRPIMCRLFPESIAIDEEMSLEDFKGLGYMCIDKDKKFAISEQRKELIQELIEESEDDFEETLEFFQNTNYCVDLTDDEFAALAEKLENVDASEFNAMRRMLVKSMVESALEGDINKEFLEKLKKLEVYQ